jgi:electron transfer flavoprotein beta subunit
MHIVVCVKQILDPEIPPAKFQVDEKAKKVVPPPDASLVINPYDAHAVELALRLKEKHGGRVSILSLGPESARRVVKHALSMGADEGYLLCDPAFEGLDSRQTALVLAQAAKKIAPFDLVLCGQQAADWDEGLVGSFIAHALGLPLVSWAADAELADGFLTVRRVTLEGYQVFRVSLPAVLTVSKEVGRPRYPSGWGIIAAAKKGVPVWKPSDLGLDSVPLGRRKRELARLFVPLRERKGEFISGETGVEAAANLAKKLREKGII